MVTPIFGRSTNCGGCPPPGSMVTPLRFQSSGMPSHVCESHLNLTTRFSIGPPASNM